MAFDKFKATELFVIGASAGGVDLLRAILPAFKKTSRYKIAVVLHMPPTGPNLLPALFKDICELTIKEAEPGETLFVDHIYIAPPDYHLLIEPNQTVSLSTEDPENFSRPSIDVLFDSAACSLGKKVIGILLSGANEDGAQGLKKIKDCGGTTIVQDPADAEYKTMPQAAIDTFFPDLILTKDGIRELIQTLCSQEEKHD